MGFTVASSVVATAPAVVPVKRVTGTSARVVSGRQLDDRGMQEQHHITRTG